MMRLKTARVWRALLAGMVVAGGGMASVPTLAAPPTPADQFFALERDVPLGPKIDRFDYQSLDPGTGRLFISGMSIGKLLVFDTSTNKLLTELDGYPQVTGVLAVVLPGSRYRDDEMSSCQCPACRWWQHDGYRCCSSDTGISRYSFGG
jgi:hypothetical protein